MQRIKKIYNIIIIKVKIINSYKNCIWKHNYKIQTKILIKLTDKFEYTNLPTKSFVHRLDFTIFSNKSKL